MSAPRATVILPTLDRAATLPSAIDSVLAQTEPALELLIVLDGATQDCRRVAEQAAINDPRVRVFDWPKAPASGQANVHAAVELAKGDHVFYIDDDDLFLPWHIERLGAVLETADVADSRVCSAGLDGRLHLGVARASSPAQRKILGSRRLKMLYDTHFAHRRDVYGRFSAWISEPDPPDPVWEFLSGFARDEACRWSSTDEVTALSLHGACRSAVTPEERASEIELWSSTIASPTLLAAALGTADSAFNLSRLLDADHPTSDSFGEYLEARGGHPGVEHGVVERRLFALWRGQRPPDDASAVELAIRLCEPVESGYRLLSVAGLFVRAYGLDDAERLLAQAFRVDPSKGAGILAAHSAVLARRDIAAAIAGADRALDVGPDPAGALGRWRESLAERLLGDEGPA